MCDMYGHGWYEPKYQMLRYNYMRWNSHREIGSGMILRPNIPDPLPICLSNLAVKPDGTMCDTVSFEELKCIPYGLDPINGAVIFHRGRGKDDGDDDPRPLDKLLIRATWDKQIPDIPRMSEWIEAHFGKRNDGVDWMSRGPRLVNRMGRDRLKLLKDVTKKVEVVQGSTGVVMGTTEVPLDPFRGAENASELIDVFRADPNEFWRRSVTDKRYDKACYVLEAAGMN